MSLRYASRVVYQAGMRVMQGIKEQAPKCGTSSSSSSSSSSKQAWRFSPSIDSDPFKAAKSDTDKRRKAEESLRTVMYLSCWGPN